MIIDIKTEELYELRQYPEKIEQLKNKVLGKQLTLIGRVNKNEMFQRREFTVNRVLNTNQNVIEEMQIS